MKFIDLHCHSSVSDGSDRPNELIRKAEKAGLAALALTDHDNLDGLDEAAAAAKGSGMEFIRGCELSACAQDGEIHILGLWIPTVHQNLEAFKTALRELREHRVQRNRIMVERLNASGCVLDYEEVLAEAEGLSVGRPHIAEILLRKGYVKSAREAFSRWLGSKGSAYEPKKILTPEEAVRLLVSVGATAAFAHPGLCGVSNSRLDEITSLLKRFGISALEAYHSAHTEADTRLCVELAARHNLVLCGGSDYHGALKPDITLGKGKGGLRVPLRVLEILKEDRRRCGLPI